MDLSRRHLLTGGALTSLCACCPPLLAPSPARAEAWAYTCASAGPSAWEGVCAAGLQQSPINIPLPLPKHQADLQPIRFTEYPRFLKAAASNPGHGTMHVRWSKACTLLLDIQASSTPIGLAAATACWAALMWPGLRRAAVEVSGINCSLACPGQPPA